MHSVFLLGAAGGFFFETSGLQAHPSKLARVYSIWIKINSCEMAVGNVH